MKSKIFTVGACAIALAALGLVTPQAQAQRYGRRGGGAGVYVGPGGVGVQAGRGYYPGYYGGYYGRYSGYYGPGLYFGTRPFGTGLWYSGRWYAPYSTTYYSDYDVAPANYQDQTPPDNALIHVLVPDPNAEVFFGTSATQQTGADRLFESPTLKEGSTYTYEIKARWRDANGNMIERTQSVAVQRGRESVVDFTQNAQSQAKTERVPAKPRREGKSPNPPVEDQPPQR